MSYKNGVSADTLRWRQGLGTLLLFYVCFALADVFKPLTYIRGIEKGSLITSREKRMCIVCLPGVKKKKEKKSNPQSGTVGARRPVDR
ncbi:hypothetical protein QBC38DRAFT_468923 [Podospora fimiseda]|uniref:Uncharacterized protein n=1 Tax=Podospora fimiseda TaxID=252190 RepID=A0AAN7BVP9_9PEZI|nr:hypothetical protein QBC38DRAFT_468923 [Podospora fimiseda]